MSTAVVNQTTKKVSLSNFLNYPNTQKFLEDNLRDKKGEFVSNLIALSDGDANIALCDPSKLMLCAMNATALNLPLNKNLGYAYIIPYKGVPSFQIGYKGLIQLALRTGQYKFLNACEVREGEIARNKFTGEIKFLGENEDAPIIGYVACLELLSGFQASLYMTLKDIEDHATRFSKMYQSDKQYSTKKSKWSDPEARPKMSIKTVLKGLLGTYGILSTELIKAMSNDDNDETENFTSSNRGGEFQEAEIIQEDPSAEETEPEKVKI